MQLLELTDVSLANSRMQSGLIVPLIRVEGCYGNLRGNTLGSLDARPRHVKLNYPEYPDELKNGVRPKLRPIGRHPPLTKLPRYYRHLKYYMRPIDIFGAVCELCKCWHRLMCAKGVHIIFV